MKSGEPVILCHYVLALGAWICVVKILVTMMFLVNS